MSQKVDILTLETEQALKYDFDSEQPHKNLPVYSLQPFSIAWPVFNRSCYANLQLSRTIDLSQGTVD